MEALLYPARFVPFVGLDDDAAFALAWQDESYRLWLAANMAHAAYHSPARIRRWMERFGAKTCQTYDCEGAQAFLAVWDDKAILVFRGTEINEAPKRRSPPRATVHDWFEKLFTAELPGWCTALLANDVLADLSILKRKLGGARVHGGFFREVQKLWGGHGATNEEGISYDLGRLADSRPLLITGHSLGGAMATIAAMLHSDAEVVTFGEPRVGRNIDQILAPDRHRRIVNGGDPVARLPPRWLRYEHHGQVIELRDPEGASILYDHVIVGYTQLLAPMEVGRVVSRIPADRT